MISTIFIEQCNQGYCDSTLEVNKDTPFCSPSRKPNNWSQCFQTLSHITNESVALQCKWITGM